MLGPGWYGELTRGLSGPVRGGLAAMQISLFVVLALAGYALLEPVLNQVLPPSGGLEFTKWIRSDPASEFRTIPILMMTTDTRSTIVSNARDCGANMVLVKPVSPSISSVTIVSESTCGVP